ncbi:hypothetical protein [Streptomonospora wellingtoniae]|uniref:DUF3168 domain-containing protein n=1 Tax=Streptomonospora wellingtoniae TaxID=3075544 RepID=A0ABU2KUC7_9ACTN|nr:hypothetical protein [Streptomonospora sp. DSM 45055]MDT0302901.1 hypothetical protein [Streptomonospora sp. DSM 45055]
MADLPVFVDAEDAVMDAVTDIAPAESWTGTTLQGSLPRIRVRRVGGDDDGHTDRARVVVSVYAATTSQAKMLAARVRQRLTSGPSSVAAGVLDKAATEAGPQDAPTADSDNVRCREAIYRVYLRR